MSQICLGGVRLVCSAVLLLAGNAALGASFDCAKAQTPQEKAICDSPELSAADDRMAAAYRAVLAVAPQEWISEVHDDQGLWIRKMADGCPSKGLEPSTELTVCLLADEDSRAKELQHMILRESGVTFVWRSVHLSATADPGAEPIPGRPDPDPGTLHASWPQTKAGSPEWHAWNAAIEVAAYDLATETNGGPQPANGKPNWVVDPGMDIEVTVSLDAVSAQLATATIENNWYGHGAAHPNLNFTQLNWMLKEKREMKPEDIFRPNSGWETFLKNRCEKQVAAQLREEVGEDDPTVKNLPTALYKIVRNPRSWELDGNGLEFSFEPYEVACRACTPDPVKISWAELKRYLQPGFVIPK